MKIHRDWSTPAFQLEPVARAVGPFPGAAFLRAATKLGGGEALFAEGPDALIALAETAEGLEMLGMPDFTDYHSPLGVGVADLITQLRGRYRGPWSLDSLPWEAATAICRGLGEPGGEPVQHAVAMVLELPADLDGYLAALGKKERHELRRKMRRFESSLGPPRLDAHPAPDPGAFSHFVRMHRSSAGAKGAFLTEAMEAFFWELTQQPGWQIDLLAGSEGPPVAAAIGYLDGETYFLYNTGYDPDHGEAAPGITLLASLIGRSIEGSLGRFDFLKGDEDYKARLGAVPRPLFRVEVGL